jgi:hypothetical protein
MHHGKFTTMREAITLGHNGEATAARVTFQALTSSQQDGVIEFLKSLQVLPPGMSCLVVDEKNRCIQNEENDHIDRSALLTAPTSYTWRLEAHVRIGMKDPGGSDQRPLLYMAPRHARTTLASFRLRDVNWTRQLSK